MCRDQCPCVLSSRSLIGVLTFLVFSVCVSWAKQSCHDVSLEAREELANVVITGTVKEVMIDSTHEGMYKGEVEIKRVLKDRGNLVPKVANFEDPVSHRKMVMIEGFGDPHICDSDVRKYDTKIFLLNSNGNGELKLNSSIVPVTLINLQHADAVVRDIPYKKPEMPKISPCRAYFCAFGAVCMVNEKNNTAYCKCKQKCKPVFAPVCGTNGVTYASECLLHKTSCTTQRRIRIKSRGECGIPDPCEGEVCTFGAKCIPSIDGSSHRCVCPDRCDTFGDSLGSTPVCGSNGVDYNNMCELHRAACNSMKEIRVKYYGKCDPCEKNKCKEPQVCQLDELRKPICKCNFICYEDFEPVCGSDGRTYSNECMLKKEACKARKEIHLTYKGKCSTGDNPCDDIRCGPEEECSIDRQGSASCICPTPCEPVMRQVCGNDSVTYDNECELRRKSCLTKKFVTVAHTGVCGGDVPCRNFKCEYDGECVEREGQPSCECKICTEQYEPVCGYNGITYENECKLRFENCKFKQSVQIKHRKSCNGCENVKCEFYAICESDGTQARCVCPTSCIPVEAEVCGSDGQTYLNECELKVAACRRKQFISIASTGSCNKCADVVCQYGAKCENGACVCPIMCPTIREPVCANDGVTYSNECEMRRASCGLSINLVIFPNDRCEDEVISSGSGEGSSEGSGVGVVSTCDEKTCGFGGTCVQDEDGSSICYCKDNCDAVRSQVCGSDGKSYGNECQLKYEACRQQREITVASSDNCDDIGEEEPCDGLPALISPLTGKDYDCQDGSDRCPSGSYCHRGSFFAKCCPQEQQIKKCSETKYGCCRDGQTSSPGPKGAGCPEYCHCNTLGSYTNNCDPSTRQCTCKPGVGGLRCDRCQPGYWGLHKIVDMGNPGCIPCNCNSYGSIRDDCDQMTGRCMCRPYINGMKCNLCSDGNLLGPGGCEAKNTPTSCRDLVCKFGAICENIEGRPECVCDQSCDDRDVRQDIVCGTDGQNYGSECQLEMFGCRLQKDISVAYRGPCRAAPSPRTTAPPLSTSRSRKTTRHIHPGQDETYSPQLPQIHGTERPIVSDSEKECGPDGNIDELCIVDSDCCVSNSSCRQGLCQCYDQFVASIDNRQCIEVIRAKPPSSLTNSPNEDACTINPCHNSGTCELDESLGFRCLCPLGKTGSLCKDELSFNIPSFSGKSFLKVAKIDGASKDLSIEIVFHTLNRDGILLFNAQNPDGTGDFVSLSIKDGHVEFRYDLGGGEAILLSRNPVTLKKSHRVIARRLNEVGLLIVDSDNPVNGASTPSHTSLNLKDPLYLGYVPNADDVVYERIGVNLGLVGCIHSFKAGSEEYVREYNLRHPHTNSDIKSAADISECGNNPCKSMPCKYEATCIMLDSVNYQCLCKEGYKGLNCEELTDPCASQPCQFGGSCSSSTEERTGFYCTCPDSRMGNRCEREALKRVYVPQFVGDSYIKIPVDDNVGKQLSIEIWFRATKPNGVLFFASQYLGGLGDFISLNLEKRKLQFKFFLGTGTAEIESKKHIHLNKWHKVVVQRHNEVGEMTVDDRPTITGTAPGEHKELNLGRPLYIGGFKDKLDVPFTSNIETGFTGSIQRIIINGRVIDNLMESSEEMRNIEEYDGAPCNVNPCQNGGVCQPMLNNADCKCPINFMGEKCNKRADHVDRDQPVSFDGHTFLNYPNEVSKIQEGQRNNHIKLKFRTNKADGLIAFQNKGETVLGDYLAIAVIGGKIELSYNLGKQSEKSLHIIQSRMKIDDGKWHTLEAKRELRAGSLQIDDEEPVTDVSTLGAEQLDTDGQLWLGGKANLPFGLPNPYYTGFNGCLDDVTINRQELHLVDSRSSESSTIAFCT